MTVPVYDAQAHHGDLPEIIALSRVALAGERTNGCDIYYSRQAYDTPANQAETLRQLSGVFAQRRKASDGYTSPLDRLGKLVDHAFTTVPFYRALYGSIGFKAGDVRSLEDFGHLPKVTRVQLLGADVNDRISHLFKDKRLYVSRTSGSSGATLDVAYTDEQYVQSMCNYLWQFELALGHPLDPSRWIYNIHHARWWLSSLCGSYRTFALNDLPSIDVLREHLKLLRPQVMAMLPSHARALAEAGLVLSEYGVEAVTTNSEQSFLQERQRLAEALGVPVRDEYSSVELEQVAFECGAGRHHVLQDSVFVEVVDCNDAGAGSIAGTNLNAWAMPMIRYLQGDLAHTMSHRCSCGGSAPAFGELLGRANASFRTKDRRLIPSASLMGVADDFLARRDSGVQVYRLVQKDYDDLELHYVGHGEIGLNDLKQQLERLFGHGLTLRVVRHDQELPNIGSYKRQLLVSHVS